MLDQARDGLTDPGRLDIEVRPGKGEDNGGTEQLQFDLICQNRWLSGEAQSVRVNGRTPGLEYPQG
jgi:hypothetical protein